MPLTAAGRNQSAAIGPKYSMCAAFLMPEDRLVRPPLDVWVARLGDWMSAIEAASPDDSRRLRLLFRAFNEAALVEAHFGRVEHARRLCALGMGWASALGGPTAVRFVVQPFINVARLDRATGEWDRAMQRLACVRDAFEARPVQIGDLHIEPQVFAEVAQRDDEWRGGLRSMYLIDSLKTLMRAGRAGDVLDMTEALAAEFADHHDYLLEARLLAWLQLDRADEARHAIAVRLRNRTLANRAVFLVRNSELHVCIGDHAGAHVRLRALGAAFAAGHRTLGPAALALVEAVCRAARVAAPDCVRHLARVALRSATEIGDEPFRVAYLSMLAEMGDAKATAELDTVKASTLYGAGGRDAMSSHGSRLADHLDELSDRLASQIAPASA